MNTDENRPHEHDSSKAERILRMDEEIAALERMRPKSRPLLVVALVMISLALILSLVVVNSGADLNFRVLLPWILTVAVPALILGRQLAKGRKHVLKREHEMDELITDHEDQRL